MVEDVTFPCLTEQGDMLLVNGQLIQLGKKHVKAQQGSPAQITEEPAKLVAITMHKEDWEPDQWRQITMQPAAFIRQQLAQESKDKAVLSIWGRSLRNHKAPSNPAQATSVQCHASIDASHFAAVLACSGFNFMFCLPKLPNGRVCDAYRLIWLEDDHATVTCKAAQTVGCLGLVRGRSGRTLGLRYLKDDFPKAWALLKPSEPLPTFQSGEHVYKLEGLPFGCPQLAIKQWLASISWSALPFRALGGTTWLIKTNDAPPPGVHLYNTAPVLIKFLPPRVKNQERIVTGTLPKQLTTDPWTTSADPWMSYRNTQTAPVAASSAARALPGPTESRLAAQDEKLAALQAEMTQLTNAQQQTATHLKQLDTNQKHQQQHFTAEMHKLHTEVDVALKKTMKEHSVQMDSRFDELLNLMHKQSKRGRAPPDDEDMEG